MEVRDEFNCAILKFQDNFQLDLNGFWRIERVDNLRLKKNPSPDDKKRSFKYIREESKSR